MKRILATLFLAAGLVLCTTTAVRADNIFGEVMEGLTGIDFDRDNPSLYGGWTNPYNMGYYGTPTYYGSGYYGGVNPYLNLYTAPTVGFPYYNFY